MLSFTFDLSQYLNYSWSISCVLLAALSRWYLQRRTSSIPGPLGLPILGNILQLNSCSTWIVFTEWKKKYGDIIYLNLAGQDIIVLGSHSAAADLLDRRSAIYSDRPKNIVARLLTGGLVFAFTQHNELWRRMRKGAHEALNNQIVKDYFVFQEAESVVLMDQLSKDPNNWDNHLRRASTSLVLSIVYGLPPLLDSQDPDIIRVNRFVERALHAASPGAFLVEYFTWMQFLPRWMSPWRRYAEDSFKRDGVLFERLFSDVRTRVSKGNYLHSVSATLIQDEEKLGLSPQESAWLAATLFAAGSETTSGQLSWFLLAMVLHPVAQKKAQDEIDRVVGRDRLPTFKDYQYLPYVRALVKEILRWRGVGPLAVPHRLCQDDFYRGYHFKKDTTFIVNAWALNRDPEVYGPHTDDFIPERHLDADGILTTSAPDSKDEGHYTYGFGRRICVGRHVANNSMFIEIASLLWCFDIKAGKDVHGHTVFPDPMDFIDEGLVVRPAPFPCSITPRFPEVDGIIERTKELHTHVN